MELKIIKNEEEYYRALNRIDELMELNPKINIAENNELEVLVLIVEKYEDINWSISNPDPLEAIKYKIKDSLSFHL